MKFFCLQVVEFYLKTGYHQASAENQQFVKVFLSRLLQQQVFAKIHVFNRNTHKFRLAKYFSLKL